MLIIIIIVIKILPTTHRILSTGLTFLFCFKVIDHNKCAECADMEPSAHSSASIRNLQNGADTHRDTGIYKDTGCKLQMNDQLAGAGYH